MFPAPSQIWRRLDLATEVQKQSNSTIPGIKLTTPVEALGVTENFKRSFGVRRILPPQSRPRHKKPDFLKDFLEHQEKIWEFQKKKGGISEGFPDDNEEKYCCVFFVTLLKILMK